MRSIWSKTMPIEVSPLQLIGARRCQSLLTGERIDTLRPAQMAAFGFEYGDVASRLVGCPLLGLNVRFKPPGFIVEAIEQEGAGNGKTE